MPAAYDDQPAANGPAGFRWRMQRLEDAVAEVPTGPRGETAAVGLFLGKTLGRWLIVLAIAAAALVLGYVGLTEYLSQPKVQGFGKGWADILCYDIQLFVLNAVPAQTAGLFPAALGIARFLAPAATAVATVETVRLLLSEQLRRWSSASASKHAVVTGDGPVAVELARKLRAEYRKVVLVSAIPARTEQIRRLRLLEVSSDPTDAGTLRAAGLRRADVLYACAELSATNAATALRAREISQALAGRSPRLRIRDASTETVSEFLDLFPAVRRNCSVTCDGDAPQRPFGEEAALIFVCLPDNDDVLNAGLAAAHSLTARSGRWRSA